MSFVSRVLPCGVMVAALLAGCYVPAPVVHASLQVSAQGSYALNKVPVGAEQLTAEIAKLKPPSKALVVEIHASPTANQDAVKTAVQSVTAAHATVAFAKETRSP